MFDVHQFLSRSDWTLAARRRSYKTSFISEIMTNSFGFDQSGWIKILGVHPTGEGRFELSACNP